MPDDDQDDAAILQKLQEHVEKMEREHEALVAKVIAYAPAQSPRKAQAEARQKMRDYHESRRADPTLPRTRSGRSNRGEADDGS